MNDKSVDWKLPEVARILDKVSSPWISLPENSLLLRQVVESPEYTRAEGALGLSLGLGLDGSGGACCTDLHETAHIFVLGNTGSGKSVCLHAILTQMLLRNTPETLRLILVDPRGVEFLPYRGIPHLQDVVTDMKKVLPMLESVTREITARHAKFAKAKVHNLEEYNRQAKLPLPYLLIAIDELSEFFGHQAKKAKRIISRLLQQAHTAGIYLIASTSTLYCDRSFFNTLVNNGNPVTKIVFSVSGKQDLTTILGPDKSDNGGSKGNPVTKIVFSESGPQDSSSGGKKSELGGNKDYPHTRVALLMYTPEGPEATSGPERSDGDEISARCSCGVMLFSPCKVAASRQLQGAFVSYPEIDRLVEYWRSEGQRVNGHAR